MSTLHSSPSPTPLSEHPEEDLGSGLIEAARSAALLCLPTGFDTRPLCDALAAADLLAIPVASAGQIDAIKYPPRVALVDVEAAGGMDLVRRLAAPPLSVSVIAVLGPSTREGPALRAGARATLHHPLEPADVALLAARFRASEDAASACKELFARQVASAPTNATMRVAAAITHEIRNPLAVAVMNFGLLAGADCPEGAEERAEMIRDVEVSLARIGTVMDAVSSLVRGEPPAIEVVDLHAAARKAVAATPNPRRVPISFECARSVRGFANEGLVVQVVSNLLSNSLDALARVAEPRVVVRAYMTAGEARISVRDNGPGVPAELRDRIFEPLFSTKGAAGTGLGLAIAQHALLRMGGALTLSGEPPPGACFRVRLRAARVEAPTRRTAPREEGVAMARRRDPVALTGSVQSR